MYYLNKIVGWLISPVGVTLIGLLVGVVIRCRCRKVGGILIGLSLAWLWIWATPMMTRIVGASLEREFLVEGKVPRVEDLPQADAIELHGGSMGFSEEIGSRGEMFMSADRVWMAARLWKAGKAPVVYVTGTGAPEATLGLLEDFGVSTNALVMADAPRNTEEEAKFIAKAISEVKVEGEDQQRRGRVLVVTSAWHMKRTMLMYEKYAPGVEAIPAACDFENSIAASNEWSLFELLPSPASLMWNSVTFHEWLGTVGYKWFR